LIIIKLQKFHFPTSTVGKELKEKVSLIGHEI